MKSTKHQKKIHKDKIRTAGLKKLEHLRIEIIREENQKRIEEQFVEYKKQKTVVKKVKKLKRKK